MGVVIGCSFFCQMVTVEDSQLLEEGKLLEDGKVLNGQRCFHDSWNFDLYIAAPHHLLAEVLTVASPESDFSMHFALFVLLLADTVAFVFISLQLPV